MWLIPGKTKVQTEIFKGVSIVDILIGAVAIIVFVFLVLSNLPYKFPIAIGLAFVVVLLLVRIDDEPNYVFLMSLLRYFGFPRHYEKMYSDEMLVSNMENGEGESGNEAYNALLQENKKRETKEERKARIKAEKKERKADDKILKDKKVGKEEKDAIWLKRANQSAARKKERLEKKEATTEWKDMIDLFGYTEIKEDLISYHGQYYGAVIEIPPVEFRFFSKMRKQNSIVNGLGRILRTIHLEYATNIIKLERPIRYESYQENEYRKLDELRHAYEQGVLTEEELQSRVEIVYDRINELERLCDNTPVVVPFYYLVLYDSDRKQLANQIQSAMEALRQGEMNPKRLNNKEIAVFLKYNNQLDFDETEIDSIAPEDYVMWTLPNSLKVNPRTVEINNIMVHNTRLVSYPMVVGNCWLASMLTIPSTKVMIKCKPMDREKSIRTIDRSLAELRYQYRSTNVDSKAIELQNHIESLAELLATLQNDNESLLNVNVYISSYDIGATRKNAKITKQPPVSNRAVISNMKKQVKRMYQEEGMRMNGMDFEQLKAFIASQVNGYDPFEKQGRGIPSNTVSAAYPWIFAHVADKNGVKLGSSDGVPVFIDFFRRDSERVNSNMVIVGKSGSGKSYATKSLLANLAADDSKIFILDPENEYTELAENLHGKFINVGNAQYGRLNPFHIITALDDEEEGNNSGSGSYATHMQFLEEFFRQIIPDCEKDAMEYLNSLVDRTYTNLGITPETDLSKLKATDYPIFDDLYDEILQEFQKTDNEYIRRMLRTLMNYIAKFSTGGRNANIWNGPSTITTDENFSVFNFQSMLANRNTMIANAQLLLVLKYIDNEIIKNREYNMRNGLSRKVVVVIDEAHVFIDEKYPIALDFMFQLAKRIRKYNGMQIVITQNIKDFVGTEEIARKSTAIINACQYSFIFSLAPNDMDDLCKLYEKAGGINENEQEQIVAAPRGQAFTIMSPTSRSTFRVDVPEDVVRMFQERGYESNYFVGEEGEENWNTFLGDSKEKYEEINRERILREAEAKEEEKRMRFVSFQEVSEEEATIAQQEAKEREAQKRRSDTPVESVMDDWDELPDIFDIPEDPAEFEAMLEAKRAKEAAAPVEPPKVAPVLVAEQTGPVAPIAPVVQITQEASRIEQMLTEFIGQFSYDVLLNEIKRTVREELLREMGEIPMPKAEAPKEEDRDIFADIFGSEETPTATTTTTASTEYKQVEDEEEDIFAALFGDDTSDGETEEEDSNDDFDIFAFFEEQEIVDSHVSEIEKMEMFDDDVVDITLEDLMLYNSNMLKRG